ncbi:MAG: hypothetical protein JXR97_11615, partial [Planctomycetes bacterium]|nr:hypothetical protein [Planctomycetota bacterium]
ILMYPFMPFSATKLREMLNLPAPCEGDFCGEWQLDSGHEIGTPEVLFPKIDDETIQARIDELNKK